jgi:uncharacterized repeat protein (TIGR03803 family)
MLGSFAAIRILSLVCVLTFAVFIPIERACAQFKSLYSFTGKADGEYPEAGLTYDSGTFYGTTFGALGKVDVPGKHCAKSCGNGNMYGYVNGDKNIVPLYSFKAGNSDGAFPADELFIQNNTLNGTTEYGGGTTCGGLGCGTVFSLQAGGKTDTVITFCTDDFPHCTNGAVPHAGLIGDSAGNFYGTTTLGGVPLFGPFCDSDIGGCGTVYEISSPLTKKSVPQILYSFCSKSQCADGAIPYGRLLRDNAGNLYGTTEFGGMYSNGTVFKLAPNGTETVLYSFCQQANCADGSVPEAGLAVDASGNLYGTTTYGGDSTCDSFGCGVVFELTFSNDAYTYRMLYAFQGDGAMDGAFPQAQLTLDSAGNLYGTTLRGGGTKMVCPDFGCGTVFSIPSGGNESVLYAFGQLPKHADGSHPEGALLSINDGYLYGATRDGGDPICECGILFKLDLAGAAPR